MVAAPIRLTQNMVKRYTEKEKPQFWMELAMTLPPLISTEVIGTTTAGADVLDAGVVDAGVVDAAAFLRFHPSQAFQSFFGFLKAITT